MVSVTLRVFRENSQSWFRNVSDKLWLV